MIQKNVWNLCIQGYLTEGEMNQVSGLHVPV